MPSLFLSMEKTGTNMVDYLKIFYLGRIKLQYISCNTIAKTYIF